jgi:hypothetical protein
MVSLDFELTIANGVQSYGRLTRYDEVLSLAHAYPSLSVFQDSNWLTEYPAELGDPLVSEAGFYLVRVTAPIDQQLVATGTMVELAQNGTTQTVTFVAGPARDFYLSSSKDYLQLSRMSGETRLTIYLPEMFSDEAEHSLSVAAQALERFSELAPYPYREFDMVVMPVIASGIEYPGIVSLANHLYQDFASPLVSVIAHEVAHQWSFNPLRCVITSAIAMRVLFRAIWISGRTAGKLPVASSWPWACQ